MLKKDNQLENVPRILSPVKKRLIEKSVAIDGNATDSITFHHSILCQTSLPYRNPGQARVWERRNGNAFLMIEAGKALDPAQEKFVELPLPFGIKARLILMHLDSEAIRLQQPEVEVEGSLTAFVRKILTTSRDKGTAPNGREIKTFKEQLSALSASNIRLAFMDGRRSVNVNTRIVDAFDLWFSKYPQQQTLWPSTIRLSSEYFESLMNHAVPLDERAIGAMSHSAMALDIYARLAQRLHRVDRYNPQFLPWTALKEQFGWHYARMRDFRRVFEQSLDIVWSQYPGARFALDDEGIALRNSPPPIKGRVGLVTGLEQPLANGKV